MIIKKEENRGIWYLSKIFLTVAIGLLGVPLIILEKMLAVPQTDKPYFHLNDYVNKQSMCTVAQGKLHKMKKIHYTPKNTWNYVMFWLVAFNDTVNSIICMF
jgi:hypothetical protein